MGLLVRQEAVAEKVGGPIARGLVTAGSAHYETTTYALRMSTFEQSASVSRDSVLMAVVLD
jgi:hypothetical protein